VRRRHAAGRAAVGAAGGSWDTFWQFEYILAVGALRVCQCRVSVNNQGGTSDKSDTGTPPLDPTFSRTDEFFTAAQLHKLT
jgi:hypothetical protein